MVVDNKIKGDGSRKAVKVELSFVFRILVKCQSSIWGNVFTEGHSAGKKNKQKPVPLLSTTLESSVWVVRQKGEDTERWALHCDED